MTKVTIVLNKDRFVWTTEFHVVCVILESESTNNAGKNSSSKGTSDGKKTLCGCSFQCWIEIYCSEHDSRSHGHPFLVDDGEDRPSIASLRKKKIDRLVGGTMVSTVSFVSHWRWGSFCFQFDHLLDVFRDKDEHFPKAIVRKQVWPMFIFPTISFIQMCKDDDLLKVRTKDYGSLARLIMREVFSTRDLTTSILPPGRSQ